MPSPFNELRERLLHAGVAPRHVRRYLHELRDHLAELTCQKKSAPAARPRKPNRAALARLGSIDDLARAIDHKRNSESFTARAPSGRLRPPSALPAHEPLVVACSILAFGSLIFLPTADTPFGAHTDGPIDGIQNLWFQTAH